MEPIIKLEQFSFKYDKTKRRVLKKVDLEVREGEFVVITGPTGAGKTTLCESLNGIIPNFVKGRTRGSIMVDGKDPRTEKVAQMAQSVGLVFQDPNTQLFGMTVEEDVAFGATNLGYDYEECMKRVERCVRDLNLGELIERKPMELSGGQKQSVAIAGIYAMLPKIIVCDEPTSMLDPLGKKNVFSLIKNLNKEYGMTVILVEHVMSEIVRYADKVVVMDKGRIVMQGSVEEVFSQTERLEELGLNVPASIEISKRMTDAGVLDGLSLIPEDLVEKLAPLGPAEAAGPIEAGEPASAEDAGAEALGAAEPAAEEVEEPVAAEPAVEAEPGGTAAPVEAEEVVEAQEPPAGDIPAIEVENLCFSYLGESNQVDDVSLKIKKGDFAAIIGQNGSGKTTLCRSIIGLLKPQSGTIKVAGINVAEKSVAELAGTIGYCFQNPDEQIFKDSVEDELLFGPENLGLDKEASLARVDEILEDVGLSNYRKTWPK